MDLRKHIKKIGKLELSAETLSASVLEDLVDIATSSLSNYLELSKGGTISGDVDILENAAIRGQLQLDGTFTIGDNVRNLGNNCLAVGNELTVGLYNFYWKAIDLNTSTSCATVYLSLKQERFPMPFIVKNGSRRQFTINSSKSIDLDNPSTFVNLSSTYPKIWKCQLNPTVHGEIDGDVWREDYNQLCIDFGGSDYATRPLEQISSELVGYLESYIDYAFSEDDGVKAYINGHNLVGQDITMINGDKIGAWRSGKILSVINDSILCIDIKNSTNVKKYNNAIAWTDLTRGTVWSDFDYDDQTVTFIDSPDLSGPANTGAYSSLNVGIENKVLRRGSFAAGKTLSTENDFGFIFGRNGKVENYCAFLWSPDSKISSVNDYGFHIGIRTTFANIHGSTQSYKDKNDIQIIDTSKPQKHMNLYKYVWGCISSDNSLKQEFKNWLGIS